MPITIADIIANKAHLEAVCTQCGRQVIYHGQYLLKPFGPERSIRQVQTRMKCSICGGAALIRVTFPCDAHDRKRWAQTQRRLQ